MISPKSNLTMMPNLKILVPVAILLSHITKRLAPQFMQCINDI